MKDKQGNTIIHSRSLTDGNFNKAPHLEITLHKITKLKPLLVQSVTDPYVSFFIGRESVKSKVIHDTLEPDYGGQRFALYAFPKQQDLVIKVMDWDKYSSSDVLGIAHVWLKSIPRGKEVKRFIPLEGGCGEVEITFKAVNFGLEGEEYEKFMKEHGLDSLENPSGYKFNVEGADNPEMPESWKDSNVAGIGSPDDIAQRVEAAKTAKEWKTAGKKEGVQVWRIENFNVVPVPETEYGQFYSGDSYIVLKTKKNQSSEDFKYDVHFWLGKYTSQDEMCVAAYKTVELDDYLSRVPNQHREVQGHESDLFLSYFKDFLILDGGVDSGFNKVEINKLDFEPRLLQIKGETKIRVKEVFVSSDSLNTGDVFILDCGEILYSWVPSGASKKELYKAATVIHSLRSQRKGKAQEIRLDESGDADFWKILGGKPEKIKSSEEGGCDKKAEEEILQSYKIFKLTELDGHLLFKEVCAGTLSKGALAANSNHVLVVDVGARLFVWIGKNSSTKTRRNALVYSQKYLIDCGKPSIPVSRVMEGRETTYFYKFFAQ